MLLGAVGDTGYNIMLAVHVLSAFVAFSPAFVNPFLASRTGSEPGAIGRLGASMARNGRMIHAPALALMGLIGFGVAGMSEKVYRVRQGWLIAAVIVWIIMNGILHAVVIPAERSAGEGNTAAQARIGAGYGAISLLLVVAVFLMIWKPGL